MNVNNERALTSQTSKCFTNHKSAFDVTRRFLMAGFIQVRKPKTYVPRNVVTVHDYKSVYRFERGKFALSEPLCMRTCTSCYKIS